MMSELRLWLFVLAANRLGSILVWVKVVRILLDRLAAGDSVVVAVKKANLKRLISRVGLSVLELPEVLFLIAPHLESHGGRSICSALRVCKIWYGSFIHLIWRDLELHGTQTPYRYILAKRGLVQSLVLWGDVPSRYVQLEYPHLTRLEVNTHFGSVITDLIDRHRKSLQHIRLKENPHASDSHSFWRTIANLPRLQSLDMTDMVIKDNSKGLDVAFSIPSVELTLQNVSIYGHRPVHLVETWKPKLLRLQKIAFDNVHVKRVFAEAFSLAFNGDQNQHRQHCYYQHHPSYQQQHYSRKLSQDQAHGSLSAPANDHFDYDSRA